jgi:UDP-3-O-acyl-N-acetylglucosamine deacetylase
VTPQTTLAQPSAPITGIQLDQEAQTSLRFLPAPADSGIVFVRTDLPGAPEIPVELATARLGPRWSSLEQDGVWIHHTEHILAALAGAAIDNVRIEIDCDRIPIVTAGGCRGFLEPLAAAGKQTLAAPRQVYRLRQAVYFDGSLKDPLTGLPDPSQPPRWIMASPADHLALTGIMQNPFLPNLRVGLAEFDSRVDDFAATIGAARTWFLEIERPTIHGLLSSAYHDYLTIDEDSSQALITEATQHKLLDFVGDMTLLGKPLLGRFCVCRGGHAFHQAFIHYLATHDLLELVAL